MLPGTKDGDLLRFKYLFTTKLISLTLLSGTLARDSRFGLGWFRAFRGMRKVESERNDDYRRRKEDRQNVAVDVRLGNLRGTLRWNP